MEGDTNFDPVRLLQEHYQHIFSMSERHLLQLESLGAISTFALQKGEHEEFHGGTGQDSFYLLFGAVRYTVGGRTEGHLKMGDAHVRPLHIGVKERLSLFAEEDSLICRADSNQIDYMVSWKSLIDSNCAESNEISSRLSELNNPSIFMQLPFENVEMAFNKMYKLVVSAGEEIITQGEAAELFYIIGSGQAEVLQQGIYDTEQHKVATLGVGDHFGEEALIHGGARNATIRMLVDGFLWVLEKNDFNSLIHDELVSSVSSEDALKQIEDGAVLLDVRYEEEYFDLHLNDALQVSLPDIRNKLNKLDKQTKYITYCDSNRRSSVAAMLLSQAGYDAEYLKGGIKQWPYETVDEMGRKG